MPLTYLERLRIAWFLWWRILLASFLVNFATGYIVGWWGTAVGIPRDALAAIGYVGGFALTLFLVTPWVLGMLPHKQFSGFRVEVVRDGQT